MNTLSKFNKERGPNDVMTNLNLDDIASLVRQRARKEAIIKFRIDVDEKKEWEKLLKGFGVKEYSNFYRGAISMVLSNIVFRQKKSKLPSSYRRGKMRIIKPIAKDITAIGGALGRS